MQETWVQSLGQEDPLEKEMATHSRILAWEIPWTEEPGGLRVRRVARSQTQLSDSTTATTRKCAGKCGAGDGLTLPELPSDPSDAHSSL